MARPSARRERVRALVTPEGATLHVRLGDGGSRAGAFLLDMLILYGSMIVTAIILLSAAFLPHASGQFLLIFWFVLAFVLRNLYFVLWESSGRSATPGKRVCRLRVTSADGSALTLDQVIARNLMREIEIFLPLTILFTRAGSGTADGLTTLLGLGWAFTFTFFPLFNRDRLRVGDLMAGTRVIVVPRPVLLADLAEQVTPAARGFRFTPAQLDAYGIAELQKLEEVLRSSNEEAWWIVAHAICERIGWGEPLNDARPFLLAYYEALRGHLEGRVLLGKRRENKYAA